ncbi:hypothetical protein FTUN_4712 [Frigoriglobus tundricola]|uniref:Uncharacterized protein n=1 Tax=Frigoriglobus tundricola TaxID=2774151 RepID=A0A6M5YSU8_9BACT|nr:hypothetical protein FTUN_4712 [Frigoriglobus tundricola]
MIPEIGSEQTNNAAQTRGGVNSVKNDEETQMAAGGVRSLRTAGLRRRGNY